jgi:hypothetical protein
VLNVVPLKQAQRIIATVETGGKGGGGGRGGGGRNQGPGRGRGSGRHFNRGRGRGRGRGRSGRRGTVHTGYYSAQDWQSLSDTQRSQVLEARGTKHKSVQ